MFAIIDTNTLKVVGQCLAAYSEENRAFVPIDKALYVKMMEDPKLYKEYRGVKTEGVGPHKIVFAPRMEFSKSRMVEMLEGPADTWIEVDQINVTLKSVHAVELIEVMAFVDGRLEEPAFHSELRSEVPQPHGAQDHKRLKFFISKPAVGYKYGVQYK